MFLNLKFTIFKWCFFCWILMYFWWNFLPSCNIFRINFFFSRHFSYVSSPNSTPLISYETVRFYRTRHPPKSSYVICGWPPWKFLVIIEGILNWKYPLILEMLISFQIRGRPEVTWIWFTWGLLQHLLKISLNSRLVPNLGPNCNYWFSNECSSRRGICTTDTEVEAVRLQFPCLRVDFRDLGNMCNVRTATNLLKECRSCPLCPRNMGTKILLERGNARKKGGRVCRLDWRQIVN